ncbi:MAG: hypothetical protein AAF446_07170, partial [Pseudomonadota bacterium]
MFKQTHAPRTILTTLLLSALFLAVSPVKAQTTLFEEDFSGFTGTGFDANPSAGQLDSDVFIVTGFNSGTLDFGGSATSGDFARGEASGGVTTGGIYAFDIGAGNRTFGIQPGGNDFTPG